MARLQAVSRQIAVAANDAMEEFHLYVAHVAKREHAAVMAAEPRPSAFHRYVDGIEGAAEETVRPNGVILYTYERMAEVVQYAMEVLFDLSPVDSGEYRSAHELFIGGLGARDLKNFSSGMEVSITNRVPYSRKIELGTMTMRVPGSSLVYQQARRRIVNRYGRMVEVNFTYRAIVDGQQVNQEAMPSYGQPWYWGGAAPRGMSGGRLRDSKGRFKATGRGQVHNRSNLRFPTLVIRMK